MSIRVYALAAGRHRAQQLSGTHLCHLPRKRGLERFKYLGHQPLEVRKPVAARNQNDHSYVELADVLLI